jgi:CRP/FNR family cyclic AMP-dependent transcriptional regulator
VQSLIRRQAPIVDRLKSIDQFRGYKKAQLRDVARLTERVDVAEGEVLLREGQFGKECFLLLSGSAVVTQKGRLVNALGPGDFFGELAALTGGPRNATVTALCDLNLLVIGPRELNAMLDISRFRDALLKRMAGRMRIVDEQLATALDGQQPRIESSPIPTQAVCY